VACSFQPEINLDEWSEKLFAPLKGRRYPLGASIELTERCNLDCVHCYIKQPASNQAIKAQELSGSDWVGLIDQVTDKGCLFLVITGGEPLLHPDFIKIFKHARERGLLISLFSNATMFSPEIVDTLAAYNLNSLEVTLYGATQETYEKVTGIPGSFNRCLHGIELALEREIPVALKSVLLSINQHELEVMKHLAKDYHLDFRYDGILWPRLDGDQSPMRYKISQEALLNLDHEDQERLESWRITADQFTGNFLRSEYVFTCGAAQRSFHIDARGRLNPCMMVRKPSYDLRKMKFADAWEKLGEIRNWKRQKGTACETCSVNTLCSQCPGWSLAINEDYETHVPEICEIGKKRAENILQMTLNNKKMESIGHG